VVHDPSGQWQHYLDAKNQPRWENIALAGHSQGGGMALFLAKSISVFRVLDFSGGWDLAGIDRLADWYSIPSKTPTERLFAVYNKKEPEAELLKESYRNAQISKEHIFGLDGPGRSETAHGQGVHNLIYKDLWIKMLEY